MIGYIYCITDTTNGKQYIGQHHYDKDELDPNYHGSGHIIKKIYNKRPETLKEEYVKTCYSQKELDEWEKYFIYTNDTLYPNGYNLSEGGCGGIPCEESRRRMSEAQKGKPSTFKGKHHSEESRRKLSEAQKKYVGEKHQRYGMHHTEESKRKMSEARKKYVGEKHPFYGKHHSEETKRKISEANKVLQSGEKNPFYGKHHSEETIRKLSKQILQYTIDGNFVREWISLSECTKNGFIQSSVWRCCNGKSSQYKGFIWKYKD